MTIYALDTTADTAAESRAHIPAKRPRPRGLHAFGETAAGR